MVISDFKSARQRPPVPMRPTFNVSLLANEVALEPAMAAPVARRKERRVCIGEPRDEKVGEESLFPEAEISTRSCPPHRDTNFPGRSHFLEKFLFTLFTARRRENTALFRRENSMTHDECTELEDLPNVGRSIAGDLRLIGISRPKHLCGGDPYKLYRKLCRMTGRRHDPCVLDTFISIVRFLDGEPAKPWWHYTAERKRLAAGQSS
jgi:hypothetical protein